MQYDDIPREDLEKEILDFLDNTSGKVEPNPGPQSCGINHRTSLVLATSYDDEPRATPLEFFNEGLIIFIFGEPGGKIANIKRNPKVCATIYEQPMDHSKTQRSIQIWGKAELITVRNDKKTYMEKVDKWNLREIGKKLMLPYHLYLFNCLGISIFRWNHRLHRFLRFINTLSHNKSVKSYIKLHYYILNIKSKCFFE